MLHSHNHWDHGNGGAIWRFSIIFFTLSRMRSIKHDHSWTFLWKRVFQIEFWKLLKANLWSAPLWYQRTKFVEDFLPADNEQHIHNWSPSAMNDENIQAVLRGHWPAQTRQRNLQNYFPTLLATKISLSYTDTVYTESVSELLMDVSILLGLPVHVCCYLWLLELR